MKKVERWGELKNIAIFMKGSNGLRQNSRAGQTQKSRNGKKSYLKSLKHGNQQGEENLVPEKAPPGESNV